MKEFNPKNKPTKGVFQSLPTKKQAVIQDQADEEFFTKVKLNSDILNRYTETLEKEGYPGFDKVQQDAFAALYKYKPRLEPEELMDPEYMLNHAVIKAAMQTNGYKQLRAVTIGDELASMVAVEEFCKTLEELFKKKKDEIDNKKSQVNSANQALQKAIDAKKKGAGPGGQQPGQGKGQGQSFTGKPGNGKGGKPSPMKPPKMDVQEAKNKAVEARKNYTQYVQRQTQHHLSSTFKSAIQKTREYSELIDQWGLNTDSFHKKTSYKDKLQLIDKIKNSRKLKELSRLMGRLKPIAMDINKSRVKRARLNYQGIKLGNELDKVIPAELAQLGDKRLKMLIYKKFVEKKLRQLEFGGRKTLGKGPIVLMCDESMSMDGDPELFSKAVGLSLLEVCHKQKRDFVYIHFDGAAKEDLRVDMFKQGEYSLDPFKMIELAEYFAGGGTNFENPLTRGREIIDEHKEFSKADMLFVTDGQCGIGDDFIQSYNKWRKEKNIKLMSVLIDAYSHSDSILNEISDEVATFTDLASEEGQTKNAKTIFKNMIS